MDVSDTWPVDCHTYGYLCFTASDHHSHLTGTKLRYLYYGLLLQCITSCDYMH